jgi:hypothetical protein
MDLLASFLVGRPLHILAIAALFLAGYALRRAMSRGGGGRVGGLLVAAGAWALYAAWEWLVQLRTPDANIRVDLLVIWPVVGLLSVWAVFRLLRRRVPGA